LKNAKRRRADHAARAVGELATVEKLAARDGACCWICAKAVDLDLPRNTRMGATVDHVVPVSEEGISTMANCRLAHLVCNAKRRRGPGEAVQLRLVG
jgi:5-methylcytosine-specific restriction endonuclease McrA